MAMLTALFGFLTKATPDDKVQEERQELHKERLVGIERDRILRKCSTYLTFHTHQDIDNYVNFTWGHLHEDDIKDLKALLHQKFIERK